MRINGSIWETETWCMVCSSVLKKYIINVFLFRSCSDNSWCGLHCRWLRRETQGGFLVIFTFNKNSVEDMWDWVSTPLCSRLLGRVHVTVYWSDKQVPSYGKYEAVYWRIPEYLCNGLLNKCPTKGSINEWMSVYWSDEPQWQHWPQWHH